MISDKESSGAAPESRRDRSEGGEESVVVSIKNRFQTNTRKKVAGWQRGENGGDGGVAV